MGRAIKNIKEPRKIPMLPTAASAFLAHRLFELTGFALIGMVFSLVFAVISYSPHDTSLNVVSDQEVNNFLGLTGAVTADLALQLTGLGIAGPILILLCWGGRLWKHKIIKFFWLKFLSLGVGTLFFSYSLANATIPPTWPLISGLGGSIGDIILVNSNNLLFDLGLLNYSFLLVLFCSFFALACLIFASSIPYQEWRIALCAFHFSTIFLISKVAQIGSFARYSLFSYKTPGNLKNQRVKIPQEHHRNPSSKNINPSTFRGFGATDVLVTPKRKSKNGKKALQRRQGNLPLDQMNTFEPPLLEFLELHHETVHETRESQNALKQNARYLATILEEYGVKGKIVKVWPGPVVTLYELEPAPGTKTSRVIGLADDIARSMSAISVRVAVVPGKNAIGIEIPNNYREIVRLRELLSSDDFEKTKADLPLALGKDIGGAPITVDLARMPHLLIAGTTGSGKSVAMNTMILSLLYNLSPDTCKFIMIDPKMLELSVYEDIPNLLTPVVTDPSKAVVALKWVVREMEDRYRAMSHLGVRNISGYNTKLLKATESGEILSRIVQTGFDELGKPIHEEQEISAVPLPFIVVVVDEMADLMLVAGKDVEAAIQRLAQMARAAGIHLMMATQRPSVDVITGTIKANFPSRISFQVTSKIDSRTILGEQGAEQLLGQGDMLYMAGGGRISRVHGPFVSDNEVEKVVRYLKSQGKPAYIEDITAEDLSHSAQKDNLAADNRDDLYEEAVLVITREGKASTSFIQRHLQIGYNRAARIIDQMESEGLVSKANRVGRREVLVNTN